MKLENKISTVRNVISDLKCYLEDLEECQADYRTDTSKERETWRECQSACEYITENQPHL